MYDEEEKTVKAERWSFTYNEDGTPNFEGGIRLQSSVTEEVIKDRLEDLLDQCIIVLDTDDSDNPNKVTSINSNTTYYKTKGGSFVKVVANGGGYAFQGGWQLNNNMQVNVPAADVINAARKSGGRIIAVGTTSLRTLESVTDDAGMVHAGSGETGIFITPGYRFKAVDALITNFHLPESTLLMLVSALMGREEALRAYDVAIKEKYRFFSFGDAMFIR